MDRARSYSSMSNTKINKYSELSENSSTILLNKVRGYAENDDNTIYCVQYIHERPPETIKILNVILQFISYAHMRKSIH